MAEYTANDAQVVSTAQAILFDEEVIRGGGSVYHRPGSGIFSLRGVTCQPFARFKVTVGGNIALPANGTPGPISIALAQAGEANGTTEMEVTPAAVSEWFNVSRTATVLVPGGCCTQLSVENTSGVDIETRNMNIVIERIA